jgi:hypothetical protein
MKWITTPNVHFDRVATPWMIKRFIDPNAEFFFEAKGQEANRPKDAIPFAIPGVKLGPHDENGPVFLKVLKEYKLQDPALELMAQIIDKGVNYVLHGFKPQVDDKYGQMAVGFVAFSDGMILFKKTDLERLNASYVVYDALYALLKANKQRG